MVGVNEPKFNRDMAATYLELYRGVPGLIAVTATRPGIGTGPTERCDGVEAALAAIEKFDRVGDRYAGINVRGTTLHPDTPLLNEAGKQARGSGIHSDHWVMYSADVDYDTDGKGDGYVSGLDEALELIAGSGLPTPTFVVETGGGVHPKWVLDRPVRHDRETTGELQVDIYRALGSYFESKGRKIDKGIKDASRIWRCPGTVNRKPGRPARATNMRGVA